MATELYKCVYRRRERERKRKELIREQRPTIRNEVKEKRNGIQKKLKESEIQKGGEVREREMAD